MEDPLAVKVMSNFLVALGVTLGGTLSGAAASLLTGGHPLDRIRYLADEMRLWGILVAMSGSFEPLRGIGAGLFAGEGRTMVRQILFLVVAMFGAHAGYVLLRAVAGREP